MDPAVTLVTNKEDLHKEKDLKKKRSYIFFSAFYGAVQFYLAVLLCLLFSCSLQLGEEYIAVEHYFQATLSSTDRRFFFF